MRNQLICIKGEALTHATFSGPDAWKLLKMGKWDKLYELLHYYANVKIPNGNSMVNLNVMNDAEFFEMQHLKSEFDSYISVLQTFKYTIVDNSIHPKMCGIGLTGALLKTLVGSLFTLTVAVLKALFF